MNLRALDYGRGGLERAFSLRLINTIEEVAGAEKDRPSGFKAMEESHGLGVARDRARTRDMSDRINVYSDRNARTPTLLRKTVHVHPSHAWTHVARDSSSRLATSGTGGLGHLTLGLVPQVAAVDFLVVLLLAQRLFDAVTPEDRLLPCKELVV